MTDRPMPASIRRDICNPNKECVDNACKNEIEKTDNFWSSFCSAPTPTTKKVPVECDLCYSPTQTDNVTRPNEQKIAEHCCTVKKHQLNTLIALGSIFLALLVLTIAGLIITDLRRKARARRRRTAFEKRDHEAKSGQMDGAFDGDLGRGSHELPKRNSKSILRVPVLPPASLKTRNAGRSTSINHRMDTACSRNASGSSELSDPAMPTATKIAREGLPGRLSRFQTTEEDGETSSS